jgi:hypothetical protein
VSLTDDSNASRILTEHVIELGHRLVERATTAPPPKARG